MKALMSKICEKWSKLQKKQFCVSLNRKRSSGSVDSTDVKCLR